jgi:hypothetical protein
LKFSFFIDFLFSVVHYTKKRQDDATKLSTSEENKGLDREE